MKTFLVKNKRPLIRWSLLPDNTYYEGDIPSGWDLAVCPSGDYVVVDIDQHGNKNGFNHIPGPLYTELMSSYSYATKNKGRHCWIKYTGDKVLLNKHSSIGVDLRTQRGYVVNYSGRDIRDCIDEINESSLELNKWLEELF